jgi:hypothetical protein
MHQRSQTLLTAVCLLCGGLALENNAFAQRGRGGDDRRRDEGDDERSRSRDDERRERFSRFFGGGGDFGGGGFGPGGFGGGDFGGGFPGGGGGRNPWGGGEGDDDGDSEEIREKPRVTLDLPSGFVAGDLDGDGQVSYYEWRRWQRTGVAEFARWDVNRDGFLTPRELAGVAAPSGGTTVVASSTPTPRTGSTAPTTTPPAGPSTPVSAVPVSTGSNVDLSSPEAQRAKNYFDALDADKDGTVTPDEFGKSRRLKPMFEKAGQPIAQPIQLPQFVQMYLVVVKSST